MEEIWHTWDYISGFMADQCKKSEQSNVKLIYKIKRFDITSNTRHAGTVRSHRGLTTPQPGCQKTHGADDVLLDHYQGVVAGFK